MRDLTDPGQGAHAIQSLVDAATRRLREGWSCNVVVARGSPLVAVEDNYDRLHYAADGVARDARYTRYVTDQQLLRTQTSAVVPSVLRTLAGARIDDVLLVCPGIVYRRDSIDRLHTGEPHQVDLWRLRSGPLEVADLEQMIAHVVHACVPDAEAWRTTPAAHPYTKAGRQIDVRLGNAWIEIGECGLAAPGVLEESGLPPVVRGLAMGLGLDRLLMLRKGVPDIRLLRSDDPRVAAQMLDLSPYRPVSRQPAIRRDLSISVPRETIVEDLGDQVRALLGPEQSCIEAVTILSETHYGALPPSAVERMGMPAGHKNLLVRVVMRDLHRALTSAEANRLRDRIYDHLHRGTRRERSVDPTR
ncbi:MAG: hypothetical protein AAF721_04595 [Myxococcota bacterium]